MFEKIIGNNQIKEMLAKSIKESKTSHSYLFIGIQGIGKKCWLKNLLKIFYA